MKISKREALKFIMHFMSRDEGIYSVLGCRLSVFVNLGPKTDNTPALIGIARGVRLSAAPITEYI